MILNELKSNNEALLIRSSCASSYQIFWLEICSTYLYKKRKLEKPEKLRIFSITFF